MAEQQFLYRIWSMNCTCRSMDMSGEPGHSHCRNVFTRSSDPTYHTRFAEKSVENPPHLHTKYHNEVQEQVISL